MKENVTLWQITFGPSWKRVKVSCLLLFKTKQKQPFLRIFFNSGKPQPCFLCTAVRKTLQAWSLVFTKTFSSLFWQNMKHTCVNMHNRKLEKYCRKTKQNKQKNPHAVGHIELQNTGTVLFNIVFQTLYFLLF